jgi:hypothetical protein
MKSAPVYARTSISCDAAPRTRPGSEASRLRRGRNGRLLEQRQRVEFLVLSPVDHLLAQYFQARRGCDPLAAARPQAPHVTPRSPPRRAAAPAGRPRPTASADAPPRRRTPPVPTCRAAPHPHQPERIRSARIAARGFSPRPIGASMWTPFWKASESSAPSSTMIRLSGRPFSCGRPSNRPHNLEKFHALWQ